MRIARSILLVALAFQVGILQGCGTVKAAPIEAKPAATVAETSRAGDRLSPAAFADPPLHARPGAFWDWLNGSITQEQITRDLEAMKSGGMRGAEIWDVAAYADPDKRVPAGPAFLGPESTRLIAHAVREADRLGLEIGIVASSGWNAGDGDSLRPESERFTRSNLDRIQTDPTSDSYFGAVPGGKTRPVYTKIPPLMPSGLLGPVQIITPRDQ